MALLKLITCCVKTIHAVNASPWQSGEETQILQTNKQTDKRTTVTRWARRDLGLMTIYTVYCLWCAVDEGNTIGNESSADPPAAEDMDVQEAAAADKENNNEEATNDQKKSTEEATNDEKKSGAVTKDEKKCDEGSKELGERDLFKLVVVNSYGSQEIRRLVDDPKGVDPLGASRSR